MSFVSVEFIIFFLIVIPLYFTMNIRWRWVLLLIASYFFYAYWNASYIILILFSTFVDYIAGREIDATPQSNVVRRRFFLILSIVVNLGILFTFKYFNFFSESIGELLTSLGFQYHVSTLNLILPVGISFYTFQSMSYTIDVYRGRIQAEKHAGIFATYVAFFPQLVAGPIERAENMLPQFRQKFTFNDERVVSGLRLILWGFFKKVVIADRLAIYVNAVYADVENHTGIILIIATIFFAFQIYCDFSGYSDIAIGVARVMGFRLMENFRQPYLSQSVREFWHRWHISLSTWFRDYVYIPLGGNRVAFSRQMLNIMIVFVVSGLWHGANWTFAIWGALHGGYLVLEFILQKSTRGIQLRLPEGFTSAAKWLVTFGFVCFAWIFFRAESINDALYVTQNLFNFSSGFAGLTDPFEAGLLLPRSEFLVSIILILSLIFIEWLEAYHHLLEKFGQSSPVFRWGVYYVLVAFIGLSLLYSSTGQAFIYFQF